MERSPASLLRACLLIWLLCALAFAMPASAQTRVWLDRDRIALDETVTLNLEIDASRISAMPDMAELGRNFRIVDQRTQQQVAWVNGALTAQVTIQLTLSPLHEGQIEIPSLWAGRDATPPLRLTVLPPNEPQAAAEPPPAAAAAGQQVFVDTRIDSETPYVQQTVGYTLRLYYPLNSQIEGRLDQDQPEGASLQKIGDDQKLDTRIGGRDYTVIERRYLLIPERSGAITVPGARFKGRVLGLFDSIFDDTREELSAASKPITVQVKPIPAAAPQPWLPLQSLRMRYVETPQPLRVGKSGTVTVEVVAEGATAAQIPVLMLRTDNGADVFADQAQMDDRFHQGSPQATIVRRFSILPTRDGTLRIVAPRIAWWDTQAGIARTASLPDLRLRVLPGATGTAAPQAITGDARANANDDAADGWRSWIPNGPWRWVVLTLAFLWLATVILGWRLWSLRARPAPVAAPQGDRGPAAPSPGNDPEALIRALTRGDLRAIAQALCNAASPVAADLDAVRARLADPVQRAAVDALERARWGDGDTGPTLAAVRAAFASGPRWRTPAARVDAVLLPPLYPER
jgi:BatD DUF11 like domain